MNKFKAKGTWSEEESVPRHGRRGPSGQGVALATFRSDPVSCATSFLQLIESDIIKKTGGSWAACFLFRDR